MKNLKTRVAATATILGLSGLTGIALSSGGQRASSLVDKPLVRTKVIHRTVRVTKHVKPRHPIATGSPRYAGGATGSSSTGGGTSSPGATPVSTGASGTSAPSPSAGGGSGTPVVTQTSGSGAASGGSEGGTATPVTTGSSSAGSAGGGGGEAENEGGGDD